MIEQVAEYIQAQAEYNCGCGNQQDLLFALERGLIPYASIGHGGEVGQVQMIAILLRECDVPEEWRLYITGALVGRELRSSKDLSMAEASALIEWLLHGIEGRENPESDGPCAEAKEVISQMLAGVLAMGHSQVSRRENGGQRVTVITQMGLC